MLQYDEPISAIVAKTILEDAYDVTCDYYLYMDMGEMSIRAVSKSTGHEVWTESRRIDVGDAVVQKSNSVSPKYCGHWFSAEMVCHRSWMLQSIFTCLLIIVAILICFIVKGG